MAICRMPLLGHPASSSKGRQPVATLPIRNRDPFGPLHVAIHRRGRHMTIAQGEPVLAPSHSSAACIGPSPSRSLPGSSGSPSERCGSTRIEDCSRAQRDGTSRIYTPHDRERLLVILKAKALGFTLAEIADTLGAERAQGKATGLSLTSAQVTDQIAHLEQQKAKIEAALAALQMLRASLVATQAT